MDFLQKQEEAPPLPPIAFMAPVPEDAAEKPKSLPATPPPKPPTPFWGQNPNILLQSPVFFPSRDMTYDEQLNAVTRLIIAFALFFAVLYGRLSFLVVGLGTLVFIYVVHWNAQKKRREMFENPVQAVLAEKGIPFPQDADLYDTPSETNPFSNLLLTDIVDNPNKKPAPPVEKTADRILQEAKRAVIRNNPTFPDIADKIFKNLGDEYEFERSMQPFYSNPSTTLPNDQQAFSDFCYGDMISCRDGNAFACARSNVHYNNY